MAIPVLHRADIRLAELGPFEPAQRYWRGSAPEYDAVARSVDGRRMLVGEAKWTARSAVGSGSTIRGPIDAGILPGAEAVELVHVQFLPDAVGEPTGAGVEVVDAKTVVAVLR